MLRHKQSATAGALTLQGMPGHLLARAAALGDDVKKAVGTSRDKGEMHALAKPLEEKRDELIERAHLYSVSYGLLMLGFGGRDTGPIVFVAPVNSEELLAQCLGQ